MGSQEEFYFVNLVGLIVYRQLVKYLSAQLLRPMKRDIKVIYIPQGSLPVVMYGREGGAVADCGRVDFWCTASGCT